MTPDHAQHVLDNEHKYSAATIYRAAALLDTSEEAYAAHEADPEAVEREERRILWADICARRFDGGSELCRELASELGLPVFGPDEWTPAVPASIGFSRPDEGHVRGLTLPDLSDYQRAERERSDLLGLNEKAGR